MKKETIKEKGKKPISFEEGGLHAQLGIPEGEKIPPTKMKEALDGKHGEKAKKEALFAKNVLTGPKKKK